MKTPPKTFSPLVILVLAGFASFHLQAQSLIDLGDLGGGFSSANGINDSGEVVGSAETSEGDYDAFLYSDGTMTNLGTLGGTDSAAFGINNAGQVVGDALTSSGAYDAFLYSSGSLRHFNRLLLEDKFALGAESMARCPAA